MTAACLQLEWLGKRDLPLHGVGQPGVVDHLVTEVKRKSTCRFEIQMDIRAQHIPQQLDNNNAGMQQLVHNEGGTDAGGCIASLCSGRTRVGQECSTQKAVAHETLS